MPEYLLRFMTVGSLAIGAAVTYIAVRNNRRQLGAQIFLAYSGHIRSIRRLLASDVENADDVVAATLLIFEIFELRRQSYLSDDILQIWDRDILDLVHTRNFRTHWTAMKCRFRNHPNFLQWVDAQLETSDAAAEIG